MAWWRLVAVVVLGTIGSVGMWSVPVVLPAVQAEFGVARADASLPYTLAMIGFAFGGVAMGQLASGGLAVAGKTALGGAAFALGGGHANDAIAESTIGADRFFQIAYWLSFHPYLLVLGTLVLSFLPWLAIWFMQKSGTRRTRRPAVGR